MSTGLLDFFILEGSECVEQLDGLIARAGTGTPDFDAFARNARALRGSATMAKVAGIRDVASALEGVVRGLREGGTQWTPQLRGAVIAAVDDLRILMRYVRTWGDAEQARAKARATELATFAPAPRRATTPTPTAVAGSAAFLAIQTADVATGLQRFADDPGPTPAFAETLARIRALRGVASLADLPPLAEVVAAVDDAAKGLEIGSTTAADGLRALFRAAAMVLREGSDAIRVGGRPDAGTDAVFAFTVVAQSFVEAAAEDDQVVPIQTLFPDDGGTNVVHAEPNPLTTPAQRFKLEVVSQAEHLRRLVGDARRAADAPSRQRLGHELRGAIRSLSRLAASFGESVVANALSSLSDAAAAMDAMALTGLDEAAELLASRADGPLGARIAEIVARATPDGAAPAVAAPVVSTPVVVAPIVAAPAVAVPVVAAPVVAAPIVATPIVAAPIVAAPGPFGPLAPAPSGTALHEMLGAGIDGLRNLDDTPLAEPAELEDDGVVPIQDLLYRGQAALRRAAQLGLSLRRSGGTPNADELAELYDLLELAAAE